MTGHKNSTSIHSLISQKKLFKGLKKAKGVLLQMGRGAHLSYNHILCCIESGSRQLEDLIQVSVKITFTEND